MRNVYTSRKRSRKTSSTTRKEEEVEDIWVAATEADKEGATVMAVVVPVAAAGGLNDDVGGIHGTLGHSEEELLTKTKPRTEQTTAAESSPIGTAKDAPIHQVQIISFLLTYLTHFTTAVLGLRICNVIANVVLSFPQGGYNMCALVGAVHTTEEPITVRATDNPATVHGTGTAITQEGGREETADVVIVDDTVEEVPSATTKVPPVEVRNPPLTQMHSNIVEDNHRISYSVPRHTMTDAVVSTYAVYHNHECSVPGYVVQV
ncbi:hypothetical protein Cgig2_005976 [Carnegiea gigantea]|uniref:Uncharacterized protein n=1 Tax=Carnegiea gigantea TaxID=171969 RepID=A0A9Q1KJ40_9CARY|nr:hypothetical protein Cgig2_005976 [Carnegiea gigantea]